MDRFLRIEPSGYLLGALCLYLLPFRWLTGALLAAAVHEMFHLLALWSANVPVYGISIGAFGAKIRGGPMTSGEELCCALAGPVGSFAMVLLCRIFPEAALCGLVQGLFNLIPVYPMDGGRALRCFLSERYCALAEKMVISLLLLLGIYAAWAFGLGMGACFPALVLAISCRNRKIPCKATKKAVQ